MNQDYKSPISVLRGHTDSVNCLSFISDNLLASGSVDGTIKLWNISLRRPECNLIPHQNKSVLSISPILKDKKMVTFGRDGMIMIYDLDKLAVVSMLKSGGFHFCNASTDRNHNNNHIVISPSLNEAEILIWDIRCSSSPVSLLSPHPNAKVGMTGCLAYYSQNSMEMEGGQTSKKDKEEEEEEEAVGEKSFLDFHMDTIIVGYENGSIVCFDPRVNKYANRLFYPILRIHNLFIYLFNFTLIY